MVRDAVTVSFGGDGLPLGQRPDAGGAVASPAGTRARPVKVGRNAPCPCGSRNKFKKCCGSPVRVAATGSEHAAGSGHG